MPLSEHEQRLLEQMERALYAEDPKFASSLRDGSGRRGNRRQVALGVLGVLVGLAVLVAGVAVSQELLGVLGFVIMLAGGFLAIRAMRVVETEAADAAAPADGKAKRQPGFMNRVEDRWNRRRDEQ